LRDGLAAALPDTPVVLCSNLEESCDPFALGTGRANIREKLGLCRGTLFI
jgi:hypothetical protein